MDCLPEISHACTANLQVRMAFAATGVPKRDTLSQSDPFLLVSKVRRRPPVRARKKLGLGTLGGRQVAPVTSCSSLCKCCRDVPAAAGALDV